MSALNQLLGGVQKGIGSAVAGVAAGAAAGTNNGDFGGETTGSANNGDFGGEVGGVAAAGAVTKAGSGLLGGLFSGMGTWGTLLGGALTAGIGTAIGFGVQALINVFHKPEYEKVMSDLGSQWGMQVSQAFGQEVSNTENSTGLKRIQAATYDIVDLIKEQGGLTASNLDEFTSKIRDVFSFIQRGEMTTAEAAKVLNDNFANLATAGTDSLGILKGNVAELISLDDQAKTHSAAIATYVTGQVQTNIIGGLKAYTDQLTAAQTQLANDQKANADKATITQDQSLVKILGVGSQASAEALAGSALVAFDQLKKAGMSMADIVTALQPTVAALAAEFKRAGVDGGAAFAQLNAVMALAQDKIAGPVITAANGLGQTLVGLHNIGQLNQKTFSGLTDQIASMFNNLVAKGYDGNQILGLMQQPLQQIWELSQQYGLTLDANTQKLIDQAQKAGIVGEQQKDTNTQILDVLKSIAKVLGADIPGAVMTGANAMQNEFARVVETTQNQFAQLPQYIQNQLSGIHIPAVTVPVTYTTTTTVPAPTPGATPAVPTPTLPYINPNLIPNLPHFDMGSDGFRDFGIGTLAVLHGREAVITQPEVLTLTRAETTTANTPIVIAPVVNFNGQLIGDERYVNATIIPAITKAVQAGSADTRRLVDAINK
jgi:hypothetical protein